MKLPVQKKHEAQYIADALLEARLVACVQMLPVQSAYWWKGSIEHGKEVLLVAKTLDVYFERLCEVVKDLHSYEVPEIAGCEIQHVSNEYRDWIVRNTGDT